MKEHAWCHPFVEFPRIAVLLAVFASSVCPASGQDKFKDNASAVTLGSRTGRVLIPTLVTDKSGAHIGGLKKENFSVYENGVERKIAIFEEINSNPEPMSRSKNPNVFSNLLSGSDSTRRVTLVVLDFINTPFTDQAYPRQELLKYLAQSVDQREPTGLFALTRSGIRVIHDFTSDPRILAAALHRPRGDTSSQLIDSREVVAAIAEAPGVEVDLSMARTEARQLQTMLEDAEPDSQAFPLGLAITRTLEGMQQVAQALGGVTGRKSVVWASGGFPFNVTDTMELTGREGLADVLPLYERTWQLLNDEHIALYPVDVGLRTLTPGRNYVRNMSLLERQATLATFAAASGGRAYFNPNDLVKGFHSAVRDSSQYYLIGYSLDRSDTKQRWRKLLVKARRNGIEVRARNGFFLTSTAADSAAIRENDIALALRSPLDYPALRLLVRWGAIEAGKQAGTKRVNYLVNVPSDPSLIDSADNNHLEIEFAAGVSTRDGLVIGRPAGRKFDVHPNAQNLANIREKGIDYRGVLDLAPGEYSVRIVVRDNLSGRIGSVAAPLKVE